MNNAGIYGPLGPSEDVDWEAWVRAMEINVRLGLAVPGALPHFKLHRTERLFSSRVAEPPTRFPESSPTPPPRRRSFCFAESLALEVKPFGIDVNAIAPCAQHANAG